MSRVSRAVLIALLGVAACLEGGGSRPLGASCATAEDCAEELVCRYGRCRNECHFDRDCPAGMACVGVDGGEGPGSCTIEDEACDPGDPSTCDPGLSCDVSVCRATCEPGITSCGPGRDCLHGFCLDEGSCFYDFECRLGCRCGRDRRCNDPVGSAPGDYCLVGPSPTQIVDPSDPHLLVVDTEVDEVAECEGVGCCGEHGALFSLREALLCAGARSPRRITFDEAVHEVGAIRLAEELPPVPSLVYLDGGSGITLDGGGVVRRGLVLQGSGVVVSGFSVVGFVEEGVRIARTDRGEGRWERADDVHLFRMRVGERARPNGTGIFVEPGSARVWIARGRELPGIDVPDVPFPDPFDGTGLDFGSYGQNVVVANRSHGIHVQGAAGLRISATWIGFDPAGAQSLEFGNGAVGLLLEDVEDAVVGQQLLSEQEAAGLLGIGRAADGFAEPMAGADPFAAAVCVGRNGEGGIQVVGGGEISMPGVFVGRLPVVGGAGENAGFGVRVEGEGGPVAIGPAPRAPGPESAPHSVVHTESSPGIVVSRAAGPVTVLRVHMVRPETAGTLSGISVEGSVAPVAILHLSADGRTDTPWLRVSGSPGGVSLQNSLLVGTGGAAVAWDGVEPAPTIDHDVGYGFTAWYGAPAAPPPGASRLEPGLPSCEGLRDSVVPVVPDCPFVDWGVDAFELDVNGPLAGTFTGCQPDAGAFECITPACEASCP